MTYLKIMEMHLQFNKMFFGMMYNQRGTLVKIVRSQGVRIPNEAMEFNFRNILEHIHWAAADTIGNGGFDLPKR